MQGHKGSCEEQVFSKIPASNLSAVYCLEKMKCELTSVVSECVLSGYPACETPC